MTTRYPITHPQRRILYTELINNAPNTYNFVGTMNFKSGEAEAVKAALRAAMADTPNLSIQFHMEDNGELTFYNATDEITIDEQKESPDSTISVHTFEQIYDVPLYHFLLIEGKDNLSLRMSFHHALCDGNALDLFAQKVSHRYQNGSPAPLKDRPYTEYAACEQDYLHSDALEADKNYWLTTLADASDFDCEPESSTNFTLGYERFEFSEALKTKISDFSAAQENRISPFLFALTAAGLFFSKRNGKNGLLFNLGEGGRRHLEDFSETTGMMVSLVPLKLQFPPSATFNELLSQT
ncbi:MAG: condensation domain-containing protein, partial [Eubacterium sp.]